MAEAVDHPTHYGGAENPYEAIKVIEAWSLGFCLGNVSAHVAVVQRSSMNVRTTRIEALILLLALPDEPCMPPRSRHYICARDPQRDPWVRKRELGIAYAEHMRQEWTNGDISCVVSVRRQPMLKMVRRAG